MILLTVIFACILLYTEYRLTAPNLGAPWNGYGCIKPVLGGTSQVPMQYRVLIPWLYAMIPFLKGKAKYLFIKGVGLWFALYSFGLFCRAFGYTWWHGVLFLAAVLPVTFLYDYADCYYELGFLALGYSLCTQGQQHLMWLVPLTLLAALNRETGAFLPLGYFVLTGGIIGTAFLSGVFLVGALLPRIYYGRKDRYCSWYMIRRNLTDLRHRFCWEHGIFFLLLAWYIASGLTPFARGDMQSFYWLIGIFILVLLVPSVWFEVRVFMPVFLVTIPGTLSVL